MLNRGGLSDGRVDGAAFCLRFNGDDGENAAANYIPSFFTDSVGLPVNRDYNRHAEAGVDGSSLCLFPQYSITHLLPFAN